ncbi:MAG: NAD(P)H-dependent oxidoreductase subunit E [Planctomycetota bacterium]
MAWITQNSAEPAEKRDEPYLTDALKQELNDTYAHRYPTRQAMSLPVLHAIQHAHGWLPPQAMQEAAEFLDVEPTVMYDTASFYEEYFLQAPGRNVVWVCQSVSCEIMNEAAIADAIKDKLGVDDDQTTPDGRVTFKKVECIGACGGAPCMLANHTLHENLTPESAVRIVDDLK